MIHDTIDHAETYFPLHPLFSAAFAFIRERSAALPPGRVELVPAGLYALIQEFEPQPMRGKMMEAHKKYIDIQYLAKGSEIIYVARTEQLQVLSYDAEKDYLSLQGIGQAIRLRPSEFCILFPQDAHLANCLAESSSPARKVVVKVPLRV